MHRPGYVVNRVQVDQVRQSDGIVNIKLAYSHYDDNSEGT